MKVLLAKSAGFCFGVSHAVEIAVKTAKENKDSNIYSMGPLIHNKTVVEALSALGVKVIDTLDEVESGTVIIRSHGVGSKVYEMLKDKGLKCVDATCPYVKSIQNKVEKYHKKGYTIVIIGDAAHPEVQGINGWCGDRAFIVGTIERAEELNTNNPVCVVSQTTVIKNFFDKVCSIIQSHYPDAVIFNTICSATSLRQQEAAEIAGESDAMIVIGGPDSSNTEKLAQICEEHCKQVIQVQKADDINKEMFVDLSIVGITAGASTPAQLILEVFNTMDNSIENLEKSLDELRIFRVGDIVTGEIIAVNENEVYLNIGSKSDGIIKKTDFLMDLYNELPSMVAIGDKVEAMVVDTNDGLGNIALSKIKVDEIAAKQEVEDKFNAGETIQGKITKIVKGGVLVDLNFTRAFMPGNQYALKYTEDLNVLLGKEVEGRIIEYDLEKNKIIFSRRVILQEQLNAKREEQVRVKSEAITNFAVGDVVKAQVKNITNFGIFIDLGGVDGFIHISDLAWYRVGDPNNFSKVGDEIEAKITEIDPDKFRIKLSVKDLTEEPWSAFNKQFKVGDIAEGIIKSTVKFGAFAEIIPGVEGLIHISNISHDKVDTVASALSVGQPVKFRIMEIDQDRRKIGLSIKDLSDAPKKKIESDKLYYKEDNKNTLEDLFKDYLNK